MPAYVPNPHTPDSVIDVVKLQDENPLNVLDPLLICEWMKCDTWTRREALMLLAGYNPNVTQWSELDDGFGQFSAGNIGYLDKLSDNMIASANVNWRHPRSEEALEQFLTLANYARGGSLDERKTPADWAAWATARGFTPYWHPFVQSSNASSKLTISSRQEHPALRTIGHVAGFTLSASPVINGATTISVSAGEVIWPDGKKIPYCASSTSLSNVAIGARKRVYLHDPGIAFDINGSPTARAILANCDDGDTPPGAYEGGLIVAGYLEIPPEVRTSAPPLTQRPQRQQRYQEEEILRVLKELGFEPIALPPAGPGNPGAKAAAREKLTFSKSIFDKAWERLRANGELKDA